MGKEIATFTSFIRNDVYLFKYYPRAGFTSGAGASDLTAVILNNAFGKSDAFSTFGHNQKQVHHWAHNSEVNKGGFWK